MTSPSLHVIMYHYVRDLPRTAFPRLKGMALQDFRAQLLVLTQRYEMATLHAAMAFLNGEYYPERDLCLLTFDDGLKEHLSEVTPLLVEHKVQGLFFVISSCLENRTVAPVHMNHFLMAKLEFGEYRSAFLDTCAEFGCQTADSGVDVAAAARTYPWDTAEVAQFKFMFNFLMEPALRDTVVKNLFERFIAREQDFASELYIDWNEARAMQAAGMAIGGHSHTHRPLSSFSSADLAGDLNACRRLLDANLHPQPLWPFSYPYGKRASFNGGSVDTLRRLGFDCSFTTEGGANLLGTDLFALRRIDCKQAPLAFTRGNSL